MLSLLQNLKLRTKLIGGFLIVIGLALVVGVVALVSQERAQATVDHLVKIDGHVSLLIVQSRLALARMRENEKDYYLHFKEVGFERARAEYLGGVQKEADS